ncbi:S-layer homology domain-containing protein [Paenibacillus silviterrae]|uniref:S-layer homology domain-containing protein n=1 Tax=Paenibacillus silviterrae TaxID=3242194 RepID=UPI002543B407|nr:S-layer homology domain-containing protein [Paenibacillus chinjuensis]
MLFLVLTLLTGQWRSPVKVFAAGTSISNVTTGGEYNFSGVTLGATGEAGFRTLGNKFWVSDNMALASPQIFVNDIDTINNNPAQVVFKANGTAAKNFTFNNMSVSATTTGVVADDTRSFEYFNVALKDEYGNTVATLNSTDKIVGTSPIYISNFFGSASDFAYDYVASIEVSFRFKNQKPGKSNSPGELSFETLKISNVSTVSKPLDAHTATSSAALMSLVAGASNTITLTVKKSDNTTDTAFTGTKNVTITSVEQAPDGTYGSFAGVPLTAAAAGAGQTVSVTFTNGVAAPVLTLNKADAQTVGFSIAEVTTPSAGTQTITPTVGALSKLMLTQDITAPVTNGGAFGQQPIVRLVDAYENVLTGDNTTVVTVSKKDNGTTWTLGGTLSATAASGVATFAGLTAASDAAVTGAQLAFSASGVSELLSAAVNLPAPPTAHTAVSAAATLTPVVGANNTITLTVRNTLGNTDATFNGAKNVTITGVAQAPNGTYGSFAGVPLTGAAAGAGQAISVTFTNGVATPVLTLNKADAQTVGFSIAGVTTPSAGTQTITPTVGALSKLMLTQDIAAPATNGGAFGQQPIVRLVDAYENVLTGDNTTVVTVSKKDNGTTWTLGGTLSATAASGVATFAGLTAASDAAVTGAQLAFSASGVSELLSAAVNLPAPPTAHTAVSAAATLTPVVGANNTITLTVRNTLGNTDATFNGAKNVTITGVAQAPNGTYGSFAGVPLTGAGQTISVTFTNGVATPVLTLNKAASQTIGFSIADVATPSAGTQTITPTVGDLSKLMLTQDITAPVTNGGAFGQQPIVSLVDVYENVLTDDSTTVVTVSKKDGGTWTLGGITAVTAASGVASFAGLTAANDAAVTGAQLAFSAAGITELLSAAVNLPAPAPAQTAVSAAATLTPVVGADNTITLTVKNALGNTDTTFNGAKDVTITGVEQAPNGTYGSFAGISLTGAGQTISVTFTNGVATPVLTLNKAASQTIGFSITDVATPSAGTQTITPTVGALSKLMLTQDITAPGTNGGAFGQQPIVRLVDAYENVLTGDSATAVTVSKKDSGIWTLGGTTVVTAASGVVAFAGLTPANDAAVTGAQLAFSAAGVTELLSTAVNLPAPASAQTAVFAAATLTPVVGVDNTITLTVKNSLNNTDTTFNGAKDVTITGVEQAPNGTYGSFAGVPLTGAAAGAGQTISVTFTNGVATPVLTLNKADAQTIGFSIAGVTTPSAGTQTITPSVGALSKLMLMQDITAPVTNGGAFGQQPIVRLVDAHENVLTGDSATAVTVSKKDSGNWTLGGTTAVTAASGVASFAGLTAANDAAVTGAQLAFSAAGVPELLSSPVNLGWPTLTTPSLLSIAAGEGRVHLTWSQVTGSVQYAVYLRTSSSGYSTPVATVSSSVYEMDITSLTNGTTYYFAVKASHPGGESGFSNELSATPQVASPGAPILQPPVYGPAKVDLTWSPVSGATSYAIYKSSTSGAYDEPLDTVSGSVYAYRATGLRNGQTYYFVVKAENPGGISAFSNEVSATPRAVPGGPRKVRAEAGDRRAIVYFEAPEDHGGSPITGYEVTILPTNRRVTGTASPIIVSDLLNGTAYTFVVRARNAEGTGMPSEASNEIRPNLPQDESSNSGGPAPSSANTIPGSRETGVEVLVNGKVETAGTAKTTTEENGRTATIVTVDPNKLEARLAAEPIGAVLTIPVPAGSDKAVGVLTGQMVKSMEQKQAVIQIKTDDALYTLPSKQINISAVSRQLGQQIELQHIQVQVVISKPTSDMITLVETSSRQGNFTIVVPPLEFSVKATYGNNEVEVTKFHAFVERTIAIPDGVDPSKITTGVVVEPGGTVRHVPTKVFKSGGKYYAKLNSLTNSTYSVIWHPLEFRDMEGHWAKQAVNDMGSRMVIRGAGEERFSPDREITRAEFAAIVVRGLGLKPEQGEAVFTDVKAEDWYSGTVAVANAYGLISGFEDGTFRPTEQITREQAMVIMSKAMKLTGLEAGQSSDTSRSVVSFTDNALISDWAKQSIAESLQAGLISGRAEGILAPKALISRAEVAVIMQKLLQKSELI